MDGVIADFTSAYREVENRLFPAIPREQPLVPGRERRKAQPGDPGLGTVEDPAVQEQAESQAPPDGQAAEASAAPLRRAHDVVWREIRQTPDFWRTLQPTEPGVVERIHTMMLRHRWEVFFITQRPATAGDTVQRQTQKWLVEQGFDLPSVLVLGGSRGAAAGALRLDYHVDDTPRNCVDVISDSKAKPILIVPDDDPVAIASARKLRIGVAQSVGQALDILEQASASRLRPKLLDRLAIMVGWK
jgi:hypothetical protein